MAAFVQAVRTWNTTAGNKTASITPAVNGLLVVICGSSGETTDPTVTDNQGGTYTKILISVRSGTGSAIWGYIRDSLVSSAVSHTVTYAPGATDTGGGLEVLEFSGMSKTGAAAALQSAAHQNQASGTTLAPVFGATTLTTNPIVGAANQLANSTFTPPASFTERGDTAYTTPNNNLETATVDSGQTLTTVTWGSASSGQCCALVIELDASAAATPSDSAALRARLQRTRLVRF